ncbi:MAG TPA: hypothetical protein VEC93_08090, partial [Anaerolineae bacterium]|nr:hypothetical protein [Anaerolineae bacterium]
MKQHPHHMLITDFSRQQNLRRGWSGQVRLAGLGLVGLLLLACNLFQTGRPTSGAALQGISYVTATPGSAMAL